MKLTKTLISTIFLLAFASISWSQSPYRLSSIEYPILGSEAALIGLTIPLNKKFPKVTPADTIGLNIMKIPGIDRDVVYNWSTSAKKTSDILLRTSSFVPIALPLIAGRNSRHKMGVTYLIVLEGMAASYAVTEVTKLLARRKRPYVYGQSGFDGDMFTKNAQKSFFSGHSSNTATNYFLAAKMFNDFYPDSKAKTAIWTTAAIIPAITAWNRVRAGKHFFTDVIVGYIVGAAVGIIIPEIHRRL